MLFAKFEEKFADKYRKVDQLRTVCWSGEGDITEQNVASHLAAARCHVRDSNGVRQNTAFCSTVAHGPDQIRRFSSTTEAPWYCQTCKLVTRLRNDNPSTTPITERRIKGRMSERQIGYPVLALTGRSKGNNLTSLSWEVDTD
jgi:hypothetical protein